MTRYFLNYFIFFLMVAVLSQGSIAQPQQTNKKKTHHVQQTKIKTKTVTRTHVTKKHKVHVRIYKPQVGAPSDKQLSAALPAAPPTGLAAFFTRRVASVEDRVVSFVHKTVSNLQYSVYKFGGGHFEPSRGVYILDCSDYVDNVLQRVDPKAFSSLVNYTGSERPTTAHYYDFFTELDEDDEDHGWTKINDVSELQPGDVLVFRYKRGVRTTGGHVMIVMDKPMADNNIYLVRVADSAASGHSHDTRADNASGIGIGTLVLKANSTSGRPLAYAWKVGAPWKSNVRIAMGRPIYSS